MWRWMITAALTLWPLAGQALDLSLPGNAVLSREVVRAAGSYRLPIAPYAEGRVPSLEVEGRVVQQAWRLGAQSITTLQMLEPLRSQILDAGYEILLDCSGQDCGGFDFRFGTFVLPAPDVFVDLFDYRFLAARGQVESGEPAYISLIVSRAGTAGYLQIIRVAPQDAAPLRVAPGQVPSGLPGSPSLPGLPGAVAQSLLMSGHAVLGDLSFESGSSDLGAGPFASLTALAALLNADPALRVALVGHTDTVGTLEGNIALSRRRAESVRERLVTAHGVARAQLDAEGMGYLSPVAPNLEQAGREANRRVEAVLLNSE